LCWYIQEFHFQKTTICIRWKIGKEAAGMHLSMEIGNCHCYQLSLPTSSIKGMNLPVEHRQKIVQQLACHLTNRLIVILNIHSFLFFQHKKVLRRRDVKAYLLLPWLLLPSLKSIRMNRQKEEEAYNIWNCRKMKAIPNGNFISVILILHELDRSINTDKKNIIALYNIICNWLHYFLFP